jgi:predicted nucleotidyltransferase
MSVIESAGSFTMPPLSGTVDGLWEVILDLADQLPPASWALVGGQMVMAHGLAAGRTPTRASQDVDVLGNLATSSTALRTAVAAVRELGFKPEPSMDGKHLHRFLRSKDNQAIDILAPDHSPPNWTPTTVPPLQTIQIAGGTQALQRLRVITITKGERTSDVPVPSVLGSLILKAAAYQVDSRDRERHAADAAFLVSLLSDPLDLARQLKGSDRKRLRVLNTVIGPRSHPVWASLGADAGDTYATWQLLTQGNSSTL